MMGWSPGRLIRSAYLFLPLAVLVFLLIKGYSATYACIYSLIAIVVVSMVKKRPESGRRHLSFAW